ncbi:MAG: hypothetical protein VYC39_02645 [Myxococcota bacterium]|nr:hypothetical protein [Myxococcota bacterium]
MKTKYSLGLALLLCSNSIAEASPWTLPQGRFVFGTNFNHQAADSEFFDEGAARKFPLRGQYDSAGMSAYARIGFTDWLEFELSLPFSVVSYQSDSVLLVPQPEDSDVSSLDYYQENVIELNKTVVGVGDFNLATRFRWFVRPFAMATEIRLKTPTGYNAPAGTFGERPTSIASFAENVGQYVRPENVQDDVTLGDGQLDASISMLFGHAYRTGTFVRANLGYNLRLADVGDQALAMMKIGQRLSKSVLVFASANLAYATQKGRIIGISVAAVDPNVAAKDYGGTDNLLLREVTLNPSFLDVGAGAIVRVGRYIEFSASYYRRAWGVNTAATDSFNLGVAVIQDIPGF